MFPGRDELIAVGGENKVLPNAGAATANDGNSHFRRIYLVFGSLMAILVVLLAVQAFRSASHDRLATLDRAMNQGYWIARSLELGHGTMHEEKNEFMREMVKELIRYEEILSLTLVKRDGTVLVSSNAELEGTAWPDNLGTPQERGRVLHSDPSKTELAYAINFAKTLARIGHARPDSHRSVDEVKWLVISLNTTEAYAHYKSGVTQSILMLLLTTGLAVSAIVVLGVFRRNLKLEQIKHGLQRFVPRSVQKQIEENPENNGFEKVERSASVLFLDIEGYSRISENTSAQILNTLVEKYFSAFLDTIFLHGGEINETAGDGIMAIFTAKTPHEHASSAVRAAIGIRQRASALNLARAPREPEILVNVGINTGDVLIGATTMKGAAGEHLTYTASGSVTNIAARLCDLGKNGEIFIAATTAELLQRDVELGAPALTHFKNLRQPVQAYRVK